ncbi:MAG: hypothetical protein SGCHY_005473, partial [Lobulomycetales sp.]
MSQPSSATDRPTKTGIITGASSGFGLALAHRLSSSFNLLLADCVPLSEHIPNARFVKTDVSDLDQLSNAGIPEPSDDPTPRQIAHLISVNLTAAVAGTYLAMQNFPSGGVIVNTASIGGGLHPISDAPIYSASKSGLVGFTQSLGHWKDRGIRVVAVCPFDAQRSRKKSRLIVPVELVVDAFVRAVEDTSLAGVCLRVTP